MTIQEKLKPLLFDGHHNDLFDEIRTILKRINSDSLKLDFSALEGAWKSRKANFNEDDWKKQMLEFIKQLKGDAVDADDWYFLDRSELKKRFKKAVSRRYKIITFVFERDVEALSIQSHNILHRYHALISNKDFKQKGDTNDWELDLSDSIEDIEFEWLEFIRNMLDIRAENIDEACKLFSEKNINQSYFFVQKITNFNYDKFQRYLGFWHKLSLQEPIFLMFHVLDDTIKTRQWDNFRSNTISCNFEYAGTYEWVTGTAFETFFSRPKCSFATNDQLYYIEPVPLKKAKELLEQ